MELSRNFHAELEMARVFLRACQLGNFNANDLSDITGVAVNEMAKGALHTRRCGFAHTSGRRCTFLCQIKDVWRCCAVAVSR